MLLKKEMTAVSLWMQLVVLAKSSQSKTVE